jgi:hypothetical protein
MYQLKRFNRGKARSRAEHQRNHEIAQRVGNRGDQEEPDHHDAVHREQPIVGIGADQPTSRLDQLETDQRGCRAADEKKHRDRHEIEQGDTLVVVRQQP